MRKITIITKAITAVMITALLVGGIVPMIDPPGNRSVAIDPPGNIVTPSVQLAIDPPGNVIINPLI